ncbi:hypothetical protein [Taklimakanibacter albus]|uniref:Uncharacterized protein n=1 Tax=Taklimakanibacter albus TaxID=2800327 RepID=A0ACC5RG00_9HYPH|nr:hypothetical protein [Aestuariivirga sp. YIM B02566]MBK1871588.1 hypothetical protein [Aestuariivirga sp. YIM B02566]
MTRPSDNQSAVDTFWRNNAGHCVSGLISTLASGGHEIDVVRSTSANMLAELCAKANALTMPLEDFEEAARQEGFEEGEDSSGETCWTMGGYKPDGGTTLYDNAQEACEAADIEPYQWEVFEHWIVDQWLAEKLAAKGQRVDTDFEGLCIWGRTCTGQAVSMDSVIKEIFDDLHTDSHA